MRPKTFSCLLLAVTVLASYPSLAQTVQQPQAAPPQAERRQSRPLKPKSRRRLRPTPARFCKRCVIS